jgi:hypothetical protein
MISGNDGATVVSDVARVVGPLVGSGWVAGVWGSGGGVLGGLGRVLDRRWRWGGWLSSFVKCATRSDERVCTTSRSSVFWAVEGFCASFAAWLTISSVGAAVLILNETPAVVFEASAAGVATNVVSDVAA